MILQYVLHIRHGTVLGNKLEHKDFRKRITEEVINESCLPSLRTSLALLQSLSHDGTIFSYSIKQTETYRF